MHDGVGMRRCGVMDASLAAAAATHVCASPLHACHNEQVSLLASVHGGPGSSAATTRRDSLGGGTY